MKGEMFEITFRTDNQYFSYFNNTYISLCRRMGVKLGL
jgi:hypothetical protein